MIKIEDAIDNLKNQIMRFEKGTEPHLALQMAIKALEQEPILDKIREIVEKWQSDTWTDNLSYECMVKIAGLLAESEEGAEE